MADNFFGEHFEGLGNVWGAIFENAAEELYPIFSLTQKSEPIYSAVTPNGGDEISLLRYSENASIAIGYLISVTKTGNELHSLYPILQGLPNSLSVLAAHTWSNNIEGVVAAESDEGMLINFFDPHYLKDLPNLNAEKRHRFNISALALSVSKAEQQELTMSEGVHYELELERFLKDNPNKTKADFPAATVSLKGSSVLLPTETATEYEFRLPITEVDKIAITNIAFYRLKFELFGAEGKALESYLYASEFALNGYEPKTSEDIKGFLWFSGYICD